MPRRPTFSHVFLSFSWLLAGWPWANSTKHAVRQWFTDKQQNTEQKASLKMTTKITTGEGGEISSTYDCVFFCLRRSSPLANSTSIRLGLSSTLVRISLYIWQPTFINVSSFKMVGVSQSLEFLLAPSANTHTSFSDSLINNKTLSKKVLWKNQQSLNHPGGRWREVSSTYNRFSLLSFGVCPPCQLPPPRSSRGLYKIPWWFRPPSPSVLSHPRQRLTINTFPQLFTNNKILNNKGLK